MMVTPEQHYEFLKQHYRASRFEERNNSSWGTAYSQHIADYRYEELQTVGYSLISSHESTTGDAIIYDAELNKLDTIPGEKKSYTTQEHISND
ncbi:hypothetical protein [Providencia sp. PROV091]|uniref:hypothetical protein n=2 Tax=unclassified Providencia TaxID=2633465 RepID=UPI00234AEA5F|nr:hypothetical protein [Providencia sp. PROV091]